MYTLKDLESKPLKELKEIGYQLDRLPSGDRRCRQNWIDVIADVQPPLLQLLEVFPVAEVEPIINSSPTINETTIEVQTQELIEAQVKEPLTNYTPSEIPCPKCDLRCGLFIAQNDSGNVIRCRHCTYSKPKTYLDPIRLWLTKIQSNEPKGNQSGGNEVIESVGQYLATKGEIDRLSPASRKVLMSIFDKLNSTNQELARKNFISENSVSVTLASLKEKGIISSCRRGRNTYWDICDSNVKNTLMINDRQNP